MINRLTNAARKRRRQQSGFTLIELLVVITILGILAAIVSISLLGITSKARENAKKTELRTVQAAFDAMLADQEISGTTDGTGPIANACPVGATPTKDMTSFPPSAPNKPYAGSGTGVVTVLSTHYLREGTTGYAYTCDGFGNVSQAP